MGYVRDKIYKLVFADEEFDGLEVRARGLTTAELLEMKSLEPSGDETEDAEKLQRQIELFAGKLVSWNLETPGGQAVPASLDGVKSQDLEFVLQIIDAWMRAVISVPGPLGDRSNGGGTFPEASLPMEPLSASRAS
jgi:hypothetical protein